MRYGVREEVRIRRNEIVEEVKCFRCWGVGHFKWKCPNIKIKRKRKRDEKTVHIASLQKTQQEEKLAYSL